MILVLSQDRFEDTTEDVLDWIEALGGDAVRLNGEDLNGSVDIALRYDESGADAELTVDGRRIRTSEVRAVWQRRWHTYANLAFLNGADDPELLLGMRRHLMDEMRASTRALHALLGHAEWLTCPGEPELNKLNSLALAARAGLAVPATLVTNDRAALQEFKDRHGRVITKSAGNAAKFFRERSVYALYTVEVTQPDIDAAPERFFPSLFQSLVEKVVEVRTFYLGGKCHSMAIFSQFDRQTAMDFRQYNTGRMNRFVPYRLPRKVEDAVGTFMASVPLTTGSLDLVRTPAGEHVFLEVNPAGQFGMVSEPCNYRLEKTVAQHLVESASRD